MPACIAACARDYPELTVQLHDQSQVMVLDSVRGGEVDFGLAIEPAESEAFDVETIQHDPFVLVCQKDHPLAKQSSVPWKKLQGQRLILLDHTSGSRRLIDEALALHHVPASVVQQTGHAQTAFRMVEAGLGVTVTPKLSLPVSDQLAVRSLTPMATRAITLIRRRHRSLSPLAELVWAQLRTLASAASPVTTARTTRTRST